MKVLLVFSTVLTIAFCKSSIETPIVAASAAVPVAIASPAITSTLPVEISSQFHAQDELGQYSYGYANSLSSKSEIKVADGSTRGSYSYIDADGKLQSVEYSSDSLNGFRVAATNLPVAPEIPKIAPLPQPLPVKDTPEVAEAKARHLQLLEEAKQRNNIPENVEIVTIQKKEKKTDDSTSNGKTNLNLASTSLLREENIALLRSAGAAVNLIQPVSSLAGISLQSLQPIFHSGIIGINAYYDQHLLAPSIFLQTPQILSTITGGQVQVFEAKSAE